MAAAAFVKNAAAAEGRDSSSQARKLAKSIPVEWPFPSAGKDGCLLHMDRTEERVKQSAPHTGKGGSKLSTVGSGGHRELGRQPGG